MSTVSQAFELLPWYGWAALAFCALMAGFSKTAIGGLGTFVAVGLAMIFPAKESTGVALLLFITGDIVAIITYRRNVDWKLLARLVPPVVAGVVLGAVFLSFVDDAAMKKTLGGIILALSVLSFFPKLLPADNRAVGYGYGTLAGFTTMVANAGGPPMNLYLLALGFDKWKFIATQAWFFFAVNLFKVPFSVGVGILTTNSLLVALALAPGVLLGTWLGRVLIKRIQQKVFNTVVLILTAVSALYLLVF
ncbi:MAG: sulfite exporter TauE/SafE family protein [Propionibacteriaceae bacterium]|jgi:uncharacterized membrane protein YfcA|nr:sulfite exporter TauE/SafE family protein [Propionibacteriaceae bacterium]